jgi:hypothetical protein
MIGKILHLFRKKPIPVVLKPVSNFKQKTATGTFYYLGCKNGKSDFN